MWCIPTFDADYVAHMEEILDLYFKPEDPLQPVVNLDEAMKQQITDTHDSILASPVKQQSKIMNIDV
ncbi:Uncharacterised protein [Legionella israelensis]|uniref:Uncharacterized protein n=1 Tax=Legionella israelensis TaxID=454 RepID=A0A0W0V2I2_9GAMM|nr:hypothetical protein Lisr_2552 [Legionella israelensis]SCY43166.1 hypothetical protein SAMN02746069_02423 [Legionella israelensis DSM 19235]STX59296.1 Uncharacterised protein [Legionella israelensis]